MKRLVIIISAIIIMSICGVQTKAQASFEPGQLGITAGAAYGTDLEELGLRAGVTYFIGESTRIGADITYWIIEDLLIEEREISSTGYEINGHFHYLFFQGRRNLVLYGVGSAGFHFSSTSGELPELDTSDSEFAVGAGVGAELNFGILSFFAEPKIFFSGFDQIKFNGGIRLYL